MQVVGNRTIKLAGATEPGELIQISNGGYGALGIIATKRDADALVVVLNDRHEGHPRVLAIGFDDECLSYGREWCLEPIEGDESYPYSHEANRRAGLLVLDKDNWLMTVAASGTDQFGRVTLHCANLTTHTMSTKLSRGAYFRTWRIWLNSNERLIPHAKPLFEFEAKPTNRTAG